MCRFSAQEVVGRQTLRHSARRSCREQGRVLPDIGVARRDRESSARRQTEVREHFLASDVQMFCVNRLEVVSALVYLAFTGPEVPATCGALHS